MQEASDGGVTAASATDVGAAAVGPLPPPASIWRENHDLTPPPIEEVGCALAKQTPGACSTTPFTADAEVDACADTATEDGALPTPRVLFHGAPPSGPQLAVRRTARARTGPSRLSDDPFWTTAQGRYGTAASPVVSLAAMDLSTALLPPPPLPPPPPPSREGSFEPPPPRACMAPPDSGAALPVPASPSGPALSPASLLAAQSIAAKLGLNMPMDRPSVFPSLAPPLPTEADGAECAAQSPLLPPPSLTDEAAGSELDASSATGEAASAAMDVAVEAPRLVVETADAAADAATSPIEEAEGEEELEVMVLLAKEMAAEAISVADGRSCQPHCSARPSPVIMDEEREMEEVEEVLAEAIAEAVASAAVQEAVAEAEAVAEEEAAAENPPTEDAEGICDDDEEPYYDYEEPSFYAQALSPIAGRWLPVSRLEDAADEAEEEEEEGELRFGMLSARLLGVSVIN